MLVQVGQVVEGEPARVGDVVRRSNGHLRAGRPTGSRSPSAHVPGGTPSCPGGTAAATSTVGSSSRPSSSWASRTTAARIEASSGSMCPPHVPQPPEALRASRRDPDPSVTRSEATACHVSSRAIGRVPEATMPSSSTPARLRESTVRANACASASSASVMARRSGRPGSAPGRRGARQHCRRGAWRRPPRAPPDPRTPNARPPSGSRGAGPPRMSSLRSPTMTASTAAGSSPTPSTPWAITDGLSCRMRSSSVPLTKSKNPMSPARVSTRSADSIGLAVASTSRVSVAAMSVMRPAMPGNTSNSYSPPPK